MSQNNHIFNSIQLNLLEQFAYHELNEAHFLEAYPIKPDEAKSYFSKKLSEAIKCKDHDALELLLDSLEKLDLFADFDFQSLYRELIDYKWHRLHENLVDSLEASIENENYFLHVLHQTYSYHEDGVEDFMVPIWSKCLWKLYKIDSAQSVETIRQYLTSQYNYLNETAKHLLAKINEEKA